MITETPAATPEQQMAAMRREFLIADLTRAIESMAHRVADSYADWVVADLAGATDQAQRALHQRQRRLAALRRLIEALADLAQGEVVR